MVVKLLKSITYTLCVSYNVYYRLSFKKQHQQYSECADAAPGLTWPAPPAGKKSLFLLRNSRAHNSRKLVQKPGHSRAGWQLLTPVRWTFQSVIFGVCLSGSGQRQAALQGFYHFSSKVYLLVSQKIEHLKTWQPAYLILSIEMLNVIQCFKFTRIFFAVNDERYSSSFNAPGGNSKSQPATPPGCVSYCGAAGLGLAP